MQIIDEIEREFLRLKGLADGALRQIGDEQYFHDPQDGTNSIAVLIKHMAGNLRSRWTEPFSTDGEKADRNRDQEFEIGDSDSRAELTARWEGGWSLLFATIGELRKRIAAEGPSVIEQPLFRIRSEPHTAVQGLLRQVGHYAYHVGQIVLLARLHRGAEWQTLSIARGGSRQFNQNPASYLEKK